MRINPAPSTTLGAGFLFRKNRRPISVRRETLRHGPESRGVGLVVVAAQDAPLELGLELLDGGQHALAAGVVAEVEHDGAAAEVVPVHAGLGLLGHGLHPALHGIGAAVENDDGLAVLEDVLVARGRGRSIGRHGATPW